MCRDLLSCSGLCDYAYNMSSMSDQTSAAAMLSKEAPNLAKSMKRCNKPLMERKRRERINQSLNQLKGLVLEALKKDTSQYSKLEKADILEMTVRHLRGLQRQQLAVAAAQDTTVAGKYRAGFSECAGEVSRYLGSVDGLSNEVRERLMHHLFSCMSRPAAQSAPQMAPQQPQQPTMAQATHPIHIQIPIATQGQSLPGATMQTLMTSGARVQLSHASPVSPQGQRYMGAFQVIPSPMNATEMATLVVPSTQATPVGVPVYMVPQQQHSVSSTVTSERSSPASSPELRQPTPEPIRPRVTKAPIRSSPFYHKMEHSMAMKAEVAMKDTLSEERVWRPW